MLWKRIHLVQFQLILLCMSKETASEILYYIIILILSLYQVPEIINSLKCCLDSSTLKRMLKPMPSTESPVTSPEMGRRRYGGTAPCPPSCGSHGHRHQQHMHHGHYSHIVNNNSRQSSQRYV